MVTGLTICRADPKADENSEVQGAMTARHTDWRKVLHAEFEYAPVAPATPANPVVSAEVISEKPADDEIVDLPKFVVRESAPNFRELEKATRLPVKGGAEKVMKKLGIGVYEFKGRHFTFGAATIFFIPVAVGISW